MYFYFFVCFLEELIKNIEDVLQMTAQNKLQAVKYKPAAKQLSR